jgi:membrane protein
VVTILAVAITIGLVVVIPKLVEDAGTSARLAADGVRWLAVFGLTIVALTLIYRFAPTSKEKQVRAASPGAVFATVVIVVGSFLFSALVPRFGSFNETYGALAGIILLLLWLYLCGFAVVLGAELDAQLAPTKRRR